MPVQSALYPLHSTTELHSSSCSVAVSSSIVLVGRGPTLDATFASRVGPRPTSKVLGSFYLSVLSSIFKKRFTSFTKFFHCFEAVFLSFSVNWCLSQLSSSHKFNFCCYAPNLAFYNHFFFFFFFSLYGEKSS